MGLCKQTGGKMLKAKAMVIGATGGVGSVCSRLLATAFKEVFLVGRNIAKLLTLQESIQKKAPKAKIHVSTRSDKHLDNVDVVVAASSGARHALDIMQLKPGCVVADITMPLIFSKEDTAKRPDVVVIRSGEIRLPGENVEMADIGLPDGIAYAGLAETIILALEGQFDAFNTGQPPHWDKVRKIYRLGLKHGMALAAVSGVEGVFSDEDIARVRDLALKE
jgi:predicted amino acid dehydrogenase